MASKPPTDSGALREQMLGEAVAMARYALASGKSVPASAADAIEKARFADPAQPLNLTPLVKAHEQLSRLVTPATPRALLAMGDEHGGSRIAWLGSVGLVRRMMGAAVISVIVFVGLSVTEYTSATGELSYSNSSGVELFANEMFWLAAAGIGASFAMLMQVNGYIVKRTYDPKYEPTYWIKFILGVMAGFILCILLPVDLAAGKPNTAELADAIARPTLAMLGGFSASAVYRVLDKLVESVEAVFRASATDELAQRERAAQTRANEEVSRARIDVASKIVDLQHQVAAGADPATLTQALSGMLKSLTPSNEPEAPAPETPAPAASAATVSLPNVAIVSAPAEPQPAAVEQPATAADAAQASSPPAGWSGGEADDDEPWAASPSAAPTVENDGTQTGAQG
ncbi:MAG TPA: hypothetical protein VFJ16_14595 [Longimicrobium sp.]|nr:hypothetical protein [Longimicrobium sp.]